MEVIHLLKRRPWGIVGALVLLAMIVVAIFAPFGAPYKYEHNGEMLDLNHVLQPPGGDHILGTDSVGRDIFGRLLYGSRPYVIAGLTAAGMSLALGLLLGIVSASIGGRTDKILRWVAITLPILAGLVLLHFLVDYLVCICSTYPIPFSLFIIFALTRPTGLTAIYIPLFISLVFIPSIYNVVRNAYISTSPKYKAAGSPKNPSSFASFSRGLVPLVPRALVVFGVAIGLAVLIISWLGYYGYGAPLGTPEWGSALRGGNEYLGIYQEIAPWVTRYYLIAIITALVGTVLFGQAVHEIWFPRLASPLPTKGKKSKGISHA